MMRVQGTMFHLQDNRARLLVLRGPISLILDKQTVMMRVPDTMFHLLHNLAKQLVLQEHTRLT